MTSCFPRRRGDGPRGVGRSVIVSPFPPQARGWTVPLRLDAEDSLVSPAGAGMDPDAWLPPPLGRRFPRRRGDGPRLGAASWHHAWFPPQARGWTSVHHLEPSSGGVSPAGAGMDLTGGKAPPMMPSFPRRRGDGPRICRACNTAMMFPPQARGWTVGVLDRVGVVGVSPAGAGMDRRPGSPPRLSESFPRRRGDGPVTVAAVVRTNVFPPQARGWTVDHPGGYLLGGVSPAGAGMDRSAGAPPVSAPCFPRRRGDGPKTSVMESVSSRFPPQARGWTVQGEDVGGLRGVSPAGAGMDRVSGRG